MTKCSLRLFLAFAAFAVASHASIIVFTGSLSGSAESPGNASTGFGFATVTVDTVANTMEVAVSFGGLTGTTTASHIHCCTAVAGTGTAGVATTVPNFAGFPLGVTSGTYDNTLDLTSPLSYNAAFVTANGGTTASAEAALIAGMTAGQAYLNIHSSTFGGGEIRSFLTETPEPASIALFLTGAGALMVLKRRRRA